MPSVIRVLDEHTVNQIAAGEVVEQAASVVKEMLENSLDAQASSILIEIKGGGRQLIRITDNGIGMDPEDALECFKRHATSKLSSVEDFETLVSMGFRGEALAAIGSVSKVKLLTRPCDQPLGTLVQREGGVLLSRASVPCDHGTCLEVADLFFNVPARRKFLKAPAYDQQEITKCVTHAALANPSVYFRLVADGTTVLDVQGALSYFERASQVLTPSMMGDMIPIDYAEGDFKIEGLIGKPSHHRPNRTGQTLLINSRPVTAWSISQAVLEGYGTSLPEKRHPVFVLLLSLPPALVDVNVHPQKKEVRFRHEGELKDVIRKAVMGTISAPFAPPQVPVKIDFTYEIPAQEISWVKEAYDPLPPPVQPSPPPTLFQSEPELIPTVLGTIPRYVFIDRPPLKNENEEGICLLDCQRARKRILYEKALAGMKKGSAGRQLLLLPMQLDLSREETFLLQEHLAEIEAFGITVNRKGLVEAIPSFLKEEDVEEVLKGLLEAVSTQSKGQDLFHRFANATVDRLKAGPSHLSLEEAHLLVKALFHCQQPYFSPTGEPILAWISQIDLSRYFK